MSNSSVFAWAIGVSLAVAAGCGGRVALEETPSPPPAPAPVNTQDRETVIGRLTVTFGDPPPGSGLPAQMRYTVADEQGRHWALAFDDRVYAPPGGIHSFNGKDVVVEGRRTESNRLLVESMRLR